MNLDDIDSESLADEYPINTRNLGKGSRITANQIAYATGVRVGDHKFGLAMLKIKGYVAWKLAERGLDVVIRSEKQDLLILTDSQAAPYADAKFQARLHQAGTALREQLSVNRANLLPEQVDEHDRACQVNGATFSAMRQARRKALVPTARERLTPGK